jgi:hypothetical protein
VKEDDAMRPNIPRLSKRHPFSIALLLTLSFCATIWADWVRILDDPIEAGAARIEGEWIFPDVKPVQ